MEERDTVICLMNRNKNSKNIKKMAVRLKVNKCNQSIKQFFNYDLIVYAVIQLYTINSITFILAKYTDADKSLIMDD